MESKKKENFIFSLFFFFFYTPPFERDFRRFPGVTAAGRGKTVALIHRGSRRLINHLRLRDVWGEWMRARLKTWRGT